MKISKNMSIGEFAAAVASYLQSKGISTVLTGGAVVSIYNMTYDHYWQKHTNPLPSYIIN